MLMERDHWNSYRDTVSDSDRHHGRLPETQEALYAVFVLHVKEDLSQLDTDLKYQHNSVKRSENKIVALFHVNTKRQSNRQPPQRFPHLFSCKDVPSHQVLSRSQAELHTHRVLRRH